MEIIIAAGIIAAALLYSRGQPRSVNPAPLPVPGAPYGPLVSGAYTVAPPSIGNFGTVFAGLAATGASAPAIQQPTVLPWASPAVWGGIAGNPATGGLPLGGILRPGLTLGTATTVVGGSSYVPGTVIPKLTAIKPVIS